MRGLKGALIERSRADRVSVSSLVRDFVASGLGRGGTSESPHPWEGVRSTARVRLSIRVSAAEAQQFAEGATRAGLSHAAYLAELVAGASLGVATVTRAEQMASLAATNAELSTLSRNVRHLATLLSRGSVQEARVYSAMLNTIVADVRRRRHAIRANRLKDRANSNAERRQRPPRESAHQQFASRPVHRTFGQVGSRRGEALSIESRRDRADQRGERSIGSAQDHEGRVRRLIGCGVCVRRAYARQSGRHTDGRSDEAIAPAVYGLDVTRLLRVVLQRGAHVADRRLEHGLADEPMAPYLVEQGALGDERLWPPRECAEDRERLGREDDLFAGARESCLGLIDLEEIETEPHQGRIGFQHGARHRSLQL